MKCLCITILSMVVCSFLFLPDNPAAQTIDELRKLTNEDWVRMSTEERLSALNISNNHARNQTFVGNFGRNYDIYQRWGYDYYEMEDRYENYAFRGFENYNVIEERRNRWYYNQFGDRIFIMYRNARIWAETHNDDGSFNAYGPSGYINSRLRLRRTPE